MRLNPDQLASHLADGPARLYLVSGDEPLLVMETVDLLRQSSRRHGFTDRQVFHVDAGFDWSDISYSSDCMSLFAERKILEIRMPSGKPGSEGSRVLERLALSGTDPDTLVMVVTGKLEGNTRKSKWYRAFEKAGVVVQIWPLKPWQLPDWIGKRMQEAGLTATGGAVSILAEQVEGNLLAADQEIRKLCLLVEDRQVTEDDIIRAVADSSRYDVFRFVDDVLQQRNTRLSRVLGHLRGEGVQPPVVLWALSRELRILFAISSALKNSRNPDPVMEEYKVWNARKSMVSSAARRNPPAFWRACLARCGRIDRMIKGRDDGNCWDELLQLGLHMARN